jgi:aminoglycoside 3-N-acetyltransferase I
MTNNVKLHVGYSYKQLSSSDVTLLKSLLRVFGQAFNEVDTYQGAVPSDTYLPSLLAKPHFIVLVAICADAVVGGLAAYELEKFEQDRREIYIYDLAVSEEHRRKGLATRLIKELQGLAKTRNAYVIYLQADHGDDAAIRLYGSLGVKESVYHFDIPVK